MKRKLLVKSIIVPLVFMLSFGVLEATGIAAPPVGFDALRSLSIPHTSLDRIESVAAGTFEPPIPDFPSQVDYSKLPKFCRVAGSIHPSADSDIRFELWLPISGWNGKFMQTGNGCSTGGRQGLMEAQRYPDDYDAIIAGAPANNWEPLMSLSILIQRELTSPDGLSIDKLELLKKSAVEACDANDGVKDGVIGEPSLCRFDPGSLQCEAGETTACLSASEVAAARRIYAGVVDKTGKVFMPGTGPGSESLWAAYASNAQDAKQRASVKNLLGLHEFDPAKLKNLGISLFTLNSFPGTQ